MNCTEVLKVILLGIIEGITEWLPISSTGHMLLIDELISLNMSNEFKEMFIVIIQLGAILAVILIFWKKMWPFELRKTPIIKIDIINIWFKTVVACIPGAIITILFDDYIEMHFHTPYVIASTLIIYGVAFIIIESRNVHKKASINSLQDITYKTAFYIGLFQVLSIIPGTSRSGATIIGALLIGVSRISAAEFTFFLAVPVMLGLSLLKLIKFGFVFTSVELFTLLLGMVVAFAVSTLVIKFLMNYIKNHSFKIFGWYRILLGIIVIIVYILK